MRIITRFLISISIFIFFSFIPRQIKATEKFITDYNVTYNVKSDGITHADMKVTLTNASSDYYYASSYKIELGFEHLSNITSSDFGGIITPQIDKVNSGYTIELEFNKKIVGVGNKQQFTLSFDTPDVAQRIGKIWEINIPGIDDAKSFNVFDVNLKVPPSFGKPAYIKPAQAGTSLHFTKEQLSKSGISLAFGTEQQYSFTLLYHLQNKNLFPIRTEIAIPPRTNYQDIFIDSMTPEPVQVKKDGDGNWLAEYELNPAQEIDVKVKGRAILFLTPRKDPLTEKELAKYLKEKPYWQISDSKIRSLAQKLRTPEDIFTYVVDTLDYDFSRVTNSNNRLGASGVLASPSSAVCLEFTDLFIALARAAGIPAREVDGFAYTENPKQRPLSLVTDILHAWPEYYDKKNETWIMVDPTWADTTGGVDYFYLLDFDHVAFVKKGDSSVYPIPAGGYKVTGEEERKDVFVWATQNEYFKKNELSVNSSLKNIYTAGFPIEGRVTVTNNGPDISNGEVLLIKANNLNPQEQSIAIGELLPYAKKDILFHFEKQPFLTNKSFTITIRAAGSEYIKKIQIVPVFTDNWKLIGGIIGVIFTSIILIITLKTRRLRVSR